MSNSIAIETVPAELRTIKFSGLLDRDPVEVAELVKACSEVGFFYLDLNTPSAKAVLRNLRNLSNLMVDWFEQPLSKKLETDNVSKSHGYKPIGTHAGVGLTRDGWEALKIGSSELAGRWALPSIVEDNIGLFCDFQAECHFVTKLLLDCISTGIGLCGPRSLQHHHRDDAPSKSSTFFLHYPPLDTDDGEVGQNMHTDIGSLTLLFAPQRGLQVLCPSHEPSVTGLSGQGTQPMEWHFVEPRPNCAIINVGDTLRFLSGNQLRSALHRVLPLESGHRYSVAYFLRPNDDAQFHDSTGEEVSAFDWYLKKHKTYENAPGLQLESILVGGIISASNNNGQAIFEQSRA